MSEYVAFGFISEYLKNGYLEMGLIPISFVMQMHQTKSVRMNLFISFNKTIIFGRFEVDRNNFTFYNYHRKHLKSYKIS